MGHCLRNFFATCLAGSDLGSDLISLRSDQIIAVSCQTIVCSLPKDEAKIGFSSKMVLGRLCIIFLLARFSSGLHRFVLTMNANYFRLLVTAAVLILCSLPAVKGDEDQSSQDVAIRQLPTVDGEVFLLPYFLGNGETGVYFAASQIFRIGQQGLIINLDEKKAATAAVQAKEAKKNKPAAEPTPDSGTGGATTATPGPKRRPQGSKKKRGNKRRRS